MNSADKKAAGTRPAEPGGVRLIAVGLNRQRDQYGESKSCNIPNAERRTQVWNMEVKFSQ